MADNDPYSLSHAHILGNTANCTSTDITPKLWLSHSLPIASGGFSSLLRGRLITQGQQSSSEVVVKVLTPKNGNTELARIRLRREATILQDAQHALVVEFYGIFIIEERPSLVFKWYEKGDATQALKGKPSALKLSVIKDIATAMEYLHSKNIVHGDLKGNNVLISDDDHGILTDFGLSHFTDKHTGCTTSSPSCAIPWLSPELAILFLKRNASPPTIRTRTMGSDVWAFGSTVFELLSEKTPYEELQTFLLILQTISEGVSPLMSSPSTVLNPLEIVDVLVQCWQVDPGLRPAMANVVQMLTLF